MATSALSISTSFAAALGSANDYPTNLADRSHQPSQLKLHKSRMDAHASTLFVNESSPMIKVLVNEFNETMKAFQEYHVQSHADLRRHHGINVPISANTSATSQPATVSQPDPPCRIIFLDAVSSRSKLSITKSMLLELMTFHQITPSFLDFVHLFGQTANSKEMAFSGFREATCLPPGNHSVAFTAPMDCLNRSDNHFELCYNLKTVSCGTSESSSVSDWSIRQAAVYHNFDIGKGTTLWTIIKPGLDLDLRLKEVLDKDGRPEDRCFTTPADSLRSSLSVHATMAQWASESWRWYLRWFDQKIEKETGELMTESREPQPGWKWLTSKDPNDLRIVYTAKNLQDMQKLVETIYDAARAIDDNVDIILAIRNYYSALLNNDRFTIAVQCQSFMRDFVQRLDYIVLDLRRQQKRANALARSASERRDLLMQYVSAQATETQERLANSTYEVGVAAQNEAIVMRIITVVTLIFLPATFVSTFFSTDIVKYQNGDSSDSSTSNTNWSSLAMYRWLQVTLPLTAVTLVIAFFAYRFEKGRQLTRRFGQKHHDSEKNL